MSCDRCENNPIRGVYFRWKNANIEIVGCTDHIKEVMDALRAALAELPKTEEALSDMISLVIDEWNNAPDPDGEYDPIPSEFADTLASRLAASGATVPLDINTIADEIGAVYSDTFYADVDNFADCLDGLPGAVRAILRKHFTAPPAEQRDVKEADDEPTAM